MIPRSAEWHGRSRISDAPDADPSGDCSSLADPRKVFVGRATDGDVESVRVEPDCPSLQLPSTSMSGTNVACQTARLRILAMVKSDDATHARSTKLGPA